MGRLPYHKETYRESEREYCKNIKYKLSTWNNWSISVVISVGYSSTHLTYFIIKYIIISYIYIYSIYSLLPNFSRLQLSDLSVHYYLTLLV